MALSKITFRYFILHKEAACSKTVASVDFVRAYSKLSIQSASRNDIFKKIVQGKFPLEQIKLVTPSVTTCFSGTSASVLPRSFINMYSTSPSPAGSSQNAPQNSLLKKDEKDKLEEGSDSSSPIPPKQELSKKDKLKQAVRDYGATVIVFHVAMSLMSLGFFYLLVQSGLDVVSILAKLGISESVLKSKVTEEAGKFVVAYAVHKVFAPLRITITLTATPLIVRKLRSMGILKQMARKTQ